jgi:hypothetical protein
VKNRLKITSETKDSVLPLPVGTGRPRPPLSKKSIDLTMKLWKMKKRSDFDHEKIIWLKKI